MHGPLTLKIKKMKTYVLTVSKTFPKNHKQAGKETDFVKKIQAAIDCTEDCGGECNICSSRNFKELKKLHTIRANYELWKKRIDEVNAGNAVLSIRYWSGRPYYTKQVEICQLGKDSGCGVQALIFTDKTLHSATAFGPEYPNPTWYLGVNIGGLAKNDGLSELDFVEWFKKYDLSKPMAIIHFTDFRY